MLAQLLTHGFVVDWVIAIFLAVFYATPLLMAVVFDTVHQGIMQILEHPADTVTNYHGFMVGAEYFRGHGRRTLRTKRLFIVTAYAMWAMVAAISAHAKETLHIYSHRHYDVDQQVYDEFEKLHNAKVRVLQASGDELIQRLEIEGRNTPADLFLTVDVTRLERAKARGVLRQVRSDALDRQVPRSLRDRQRYWYAITARARVIVYNPQLVRGRSVATYQDLALPSWRGDVVARTSQHGYTIGLLSALIHHYGAQQMTQWVDGVAANFARTPRGNDRDQMRAVATGDAVATIVNSYYYGLMIEAGGADERLAKQLAIQYPNQQEEGAHINISGGAVVAASDNVKLARTMLEYLTSEAVQKKIANANHEIPVHPAVDISTIMLQWGTPTLDYDSLASIGTHWQQALDIFTQSNWQ